MDKDLLYNGSGVKDETAYKALKEMELYMNINSGEVWEVENGQSTRMVVVLNCFERYAATVMLQDQEQGENTVAIKVRGIMYADAGRLGYVFYDKMVDYVRTLTEEEEAELRKAICEALKLGAQDPGTDAVIAEWKRALESNKAATQCATEQLEEAKKAIVEISKARDYEANKAVEWMEKAECLRIELEELRRPVENTGSAEQGYIELVEEYSLREDLAAVRKEAEVYKGLYEKLLEKVL